MVEPQLVMLKNMCSSHILHPAYLPSNSVSGEKVKNPFKKLRGFGFLTNDYQIFDEWFVYIKYSIYLWPIN